MKREATKYRGVYQRTSANRKHAGKADVCFDIAYKIDGKLKWEKVGWLSEGYSAKLASDIRADRLRSIRHNQELPHQKKKSPYFKDIAEKYLAWAADNKARAGRDDSSLYKNHLTAEFQDKRLTEISSFDLERFKGQLLKKGLAPASVKHCLVLFRQIFNKAMLWRLYEGKNPLKGVKMPVVQNERTRFLSYEEAHLLLNELAKMKYPALHDMALLSLHCGFRAGEIFKLTGNDADFQNDLIKITDPKNKNTRYAFMPASVKKILLGRKPENPEDLFFPDRDGKTISSISQSFRKIVNNLGFNNGITDRRELVSFHTLRHTFASWLALQGETQLTIKELLGHKTMAMTERYSHLIPDHKRRAVRNMENSFQKNKNIISIDKPK